MERPVTFEQTAEGFLEALRRGGVAARAERAAYRRSGWRVMVLGILFILPAAIVLRRFESEPRQWFGLLVIVPTFVVGFGWALMRAGAKGSSSRERLEVRLGEHGPLPRKCVYAIGEEGLVFDHGHSRGVVRWTAIRDIERANGYLRVEYFRREGFLIPVSAFVSEDEAGVFEGVIREKIAGRGGALAG